MSIEEYTPWENLKGIVSDKCLKIAFDLLPNNSAEKKELGVFLLSYFRGSVDRGGYEQQKDVTGVFWHDLLRHDFWTIFLCVVSTRGNKEKAKQKALCCDGLWGKDTRQRDREHFST